MSTERELEFRILTTAETRGLEDTTRALEDVQRAGDDTTRDLDDLGRGLDDLGDDARTSARDVGAAMDGMAKDTKQATDTMDRDLKDAGSEGFSTLKDEAAGSGREAAASFTGSFDDIAGGVQEVAANAFGGFGKLGAGAGILAAGGIGLITAAMTEAKERLDELTAAFTDLKIEGGGMGEAVKIVLDNLRDNDQLVSLQEDAKKLGIDWAALARAMAGSEPDIAAVRTRMDELEKSGAGNIATSGGLTNAFGEVNRALGLSGTALNDAAAEARAYNTAMQGAEGDTADASGEFVVATGTANDLRDALQNPFDVKINVDAPSAAQLDAIRRGIVQGIGPIRLDAPRIPAPIFYRGTP